MTEAEYRAFERASEFKHEYLDGEIVAMTGVSRNHNLITSAVIALLYNQLRGRPCEIYPSDMKVYAPATHSYTYPDITVVCGEAQFDDDHRDILLNPTVVIEVLSPSTEAFDRSQKFQNYWQIPSLQAYILIAQDQPRIERFTRQGVNEWLLNVAVGVDQTLALPAIDCTLVLADVYEQVDFTSGDTE